MDQGDVDRVVRIVKRTVPRSFDAEDIALDILIESWQKKVEVPSVVFIKHRCIDAIRRFQGERRMVQGMYPPAPDRDRGIEDRDQAGRLLKGALDHAERKIIWYRYYQDMSVLEISEKVHKDVRTVRSILAEALDKMRRWSEEHS